MKENTIIAVGASAGGLEALQDFLSHLPAEIRNTSIIIAQHLSPTHKSMLVQLLSRETKLNVIEASQGSSLLADTVYITPPDSEIVLENNRIELRKPSFLAGPKPSVDILFESLSNNLDFNIIAVILSGTGSDGASGVKAVHESGGLVIVQEPSTAKYDGMPVAAIETGMVDIIEHPSRMGEEIKAFLLNPNWQQEKETEIEKVQGNSLQQIFKLLSIRSGTDFANYKPTTICRRITKRLAKLHITNIDEYLAYIKNEPKELDELFNMILIGVTQFFRDPEAFNALHVYLTKLIASKREKDHLRIWVAGCATGEEPYSLAILISKMLGEKRGKLNIQIFATDIDEKAISIARRGIYPESALEHLDKATIETYFTRKGNYVELSKTIRSMVLFSRHDITSNPPFMRLDLISCRNLLIYFGADLQKLIMPVFHYALLPDSYLFLGKSESVGEFSDLFNVVNSKNKIFQRKPGNSISTVRFSGLRAQKQVQLLPQVTPKVENRLLTVKEMVKETLYSTFEHPFIVINDSFEIQEVEGDVRLYVSFPSGSMNFNLLKFINPELLIELRSLLANAFNHNETGYGKPKRFELFEKIHGVRLIVKPLRGLGKLPDLAMVIFEKLITDESVPFVNMNEKGLNDNRILELEQELAATKEHLQSYIEEIETSNEELQSLNEEMQSTNEELQSSNEELETNNEELQSTNEEIQIAYNELKVANEELERKEKEINHANAMFNALFDNTQQGNVLMENNFTIRLVNKRAEELFSYIGIGNEIKDKNILEIIPETFVSDFLPFLRNAIISKGEEKQVFPIKKSNGNIVYLEFCCTPVSTPVPSENSFFNIGIIDLTSLIERENDLFQKDSILVSMLESNTTYLIRTDMEGNYTYVNEAFCEKFGYTKEQLLGHHFGGTIHEGDLGECEKAIFALFQKPGSVQSVKMRKPNPVGGYFNTLWEFVAIRNKEGDILEIQCMGRDITDELKAQKMLLEERDYLELVIRSGRIGIWELDVETQEITVNKQWADFLGYYFKGMKLNYNEWAKLLHPEEIEKVLAALIGCIDGVDSFFTSEYQMLSSEGEWRWFIASGKVLDRNENGKATRILGIYQDITEAKKAEESIRTIESRNSVILDTMDEGVVLQDLNGNIIASNASAERILGLTHDQLTGRTSIDERWKTIKESGEPFSGEEHPAMVTIKTGEPQTGIVMGVYKPDESLTWISINSMLIKRPNKEESEGVYAIFHEVTERKMRDDEQRKLIKQLTLTIEDLTQFSHIVSHNLRSPLTNILGMTKLIQQQRAQNETVKMGEMIHISALKLDEVIKDLNELLSLRNKATEFHEILFNNVLEEVTLLLEKNIHESSATISSNFTALPGMLTVKAYMVSIFYNLISNSIKYAREGIAPIIEITSRKDNDNLIITFKDNGKGIELGKNSDKIFKLYQRFDITKEGKGMGLYVTKSNINLLGGNITLDSKINEGTTFTITFPFRQMNIGF